MNAEVQSLLEAAAATRDRHVRLALLLRFGSGLPPLPQSDKSERNRVPGCLAQLWLVREFRLGQCWFRCDSDSAVVKAGAGLLCAYHEGQTPEEILNCQRDILAEAGVTQHLTPSRRNGLSRVREAIREFAKTCRRA